MLIAFCSAGNDQSRASDVPIIIIIYYAGSDFTTSIIDNMESSENVSNPLLQCSNEHN